MRGFSFSRLGALIVKETKQMLRDPSTFLVAGLLPVILLLLFAYAVSLDIRNLPIGIVRQSDSVKAQSLSAKYSGSRYFVVHPMRDMNEAQSAIKSGAIRGIIIIPQNLDERISRPDLGPIVEIISDGTQPNTARFLANASSGVAQLWLQDNFGKTPQFQATMASRIEVIPHYWFNAEIESRRTLIPGAIAIVMTMIGTLLTAMVVAREFERGTMEALMATPASRIEILAGKLIPYFLLGLVATAICTILAVFAFGVPLRGSLFGLFAASSAFLIPALGQGLLISSATKNQFVASQIALFAGFLPAMMLSGFIYETSSMPVPLQIMSNIVAAKYYVSSLRSVFLVGDVWGVILPNIGFMLLIGALFFFLAFRATAKTLDGKE